LTILKGILDAGSTAVAVAYLAALALAFIGMAGIVMEMLYARPDGADSPRTGKGDGGLLGEAPVGPSRQKATVPFSAAREPLWSIVPPAILGSAVLVLGLWLPPQLVTLLQSAAALVGGR
jgi:hypothetical protein